jgi:hypothetical protein
MRCLLATDTGLNQLAFVGMVSDNRLTEGPRWLASTCDSTFNTAAATAAAKGRPFKTVTA